MKTAMQELIEHLEIMDLEGTSVYKKAKLLLIDEKEQITKTWNDCKLSIIFKEPKDAEEYYNQTYNQNK